jgi:hypothetical protein
LKILKKNEDIKCECGRLLATVNDKWIHVVGKTNYSSNGVEGVFICQKCGRKTELKLIDNLK